MIRTKLVGIIIAFLSLIICFNVQAQTSTVIEKKIIVSPVPKSVSCTTITAHWEDNIWIDQQTVCKYEGRAEGIEWVQDYWACIVSTADGQCTTWEYRPGHWIKS